MTDDGAVFYDEIVVTPAMIKDGVEALERHLLEDCLYQVGRDQAVTDVFLAMFRRPESEVALYHQAPGVRIVWD